MTRRMIRAKRCTKRFVDALVRLIEKALERAKLQRGQNLALLTK